MGAGFMGKMHGNVYRSLPNAQLIGVVERQVERAQAYTNEFGVPAFSTLAEAQSHVDFDAVDICLPTHLHKEATIEALLAGKDVLCEKPMALSLADADEMIRVSHESGRRLMIAHCIRFWPEYAKLKELKDSGELGDLLSLNLTRYSQFPYWSSDNWLANELLSGGGVLDMHIHDTDFALYLCGEPDEMKSSGTVDEKGASHVFTTFRFGKTIVHAEGGWNLSSNAPFKMSFRAVFERGTVIWDASPFTIYRPDSAPEVVEFAQVEAEGGGNISSLGGYFVTIREFIDRLQDGKPFVVSTVESSRRSVQTVLEEIAQIKSS